MPVDPTTKLEERVKTLEYEVNKLRSHLKGVLLNIHEQVLLRYYPDLKADDEPSQEDSNFEEGANLDEDDALIVKVPGAPAPTARKVSLNEIRGAPQEPSLAARQGGNGH